MRTDTLLSTFPDGSCVEMSFNIEARTIVIEINEEARPQRYQLNFEQCELVSFTFSYELCGSDCSLYDIVNLVEKTDFGSKVRFFHIEFSDDSILEIRCSKFWMQPIDGFWLHANPPKSQ
jgi:hypothetical protein